MIPRLRDNGKDTACGPFWLPEGQAVHSLPAPKAARKACSLFYEPEAWGSYHYIIVGPDQPSAYLTKSPNLYNDAHSAFGVELLVKEDALPEIVLLSKLDSRLYAVIFFRNRL